MNEQVIPNDSAETVAETTVDDVETVPDRAAEPEVTQPAAAETPAAKAPVAETESGDAGVEGLAPIDETETPPDKTADEGPPPAASKPSSGKEPDEESQAGGLATIHDLKEGQRLAGTVKTTTDFGAFVDLGIAQDGLVHISQLARGRVGSVSDVVSEGDNVTVWVKKVDKKRGRISLTMLKPIKLRWRDIKENAELDGVVTRTENYGAFVDIGAERDGLVHVSELTHDYIGSPAEVVSVGQDVRVRVLKVDRKKRQVDLSMKALLPPPSAPMTAEPQTATIDQETATEEETPTAMALAMQAALGDLPASTKSTGKRQHGKRRGRRKQKEINRLIYRTLEDQKNQG